MMVEIDIITGISVRPIGRAVIIFSITVQFIVIDNISLCDQRQNVQITDKTDIINC